jgi:hypothetical protein
MKQEKTILITIGFTITASGTVTGTALIELVHLEYGYIA